MSKTILVIGAGPIIIGQGCEFDYSGTQACRALKKEGYRVVLINSNPATIMTDPDTADSIYIEPITPDYITQIIEKEKPAALLPTMGGQVALNCARELARRGVLDKYKIQLLGASIETIENAENREKFKSIIESLHLETPRCAFIHSLEEAKKYISDFSFPVIVRPSFTLGGSGGGIAYDEENYLNLCQQGLTLSPIHQIMVDESLLGWKEYELEVMRDKNNNCVVICTIENLDPMGIHTGDSITVAPAMTLTDKEYQCMREAAFQILNAVGLETGGANIQFAVHPKTGRMLVIEMNPRVSRSSALASKATGYPIAKIATQLAVGYTLPELLNEITAQFPASFEPVLDYIVVKMPRFNFDKFPETKPLLSTQMKSVGEVMAIGRTFQEALQKAIQSLEIGHCGLDSVTFNKSLLNTYHPERLWMIAHAFRVGFTCHELHELTQIDPWFLNEIDELVQFEKKISSFSLETLQKDMLLEAKQKGFSDKFLSQLLHCDESQLFSLRKKCNIQACFKKIDTCAAEFQAKTGYFYSTYEDECEASPSANKKIIVIGSGSNRIGQGIEFDYACVHALFAIKEMGYEAIMINCNPETVSTDYDVADKLYFEPLTVEHVMAIIEKEKPVGVILQTGGQTALKLVEPLSKLSIPILGTAADNILIAENRSLFREILQKLNLKQPANFTIHSPSEKCHAISFPVIVRPSHILGGQAMKIIHSDSEFKNYFQTHSIEANAYPLLVENYLEDAIEIDVDAICDGEEVKICGILEHIEPAGIHSGDSACHYPCTLPYEIQRELTSQVNVLARALKVKGFLNVQFAIQNDIIYIIEANPRASRTIPFLAKASHVPWAKLGVACMLGKKIHEFSIPENVPQEYSVKEVVFPFNKFPDVNFILGPQMKSTGEVMGRGHSLSDAFLRAQQAAGFKIQFKKQDYVLILNYVSLPEKYELIKNKCNQLHLNVLNDFENEIDFQKIHILFENKKIAFLFFLPSSIPDPFLKKVMKRVIHQNLYYASTLQGALRLLEAVS